jgi:hypothetical protein
MEKVISSMVDGLMYFTPTAMIFQHDFRFGDENCAKDQAFG